METLDLHLSQDDLERYVLGHADGYLADVVEDHLLLCPLCRAELDRLEEDIALMRIVFSEQTS